MADPPMCREAQLEKTQRRRKNDKYHGCTAKKIIKKIRKKRRKIVRFIEQRRRKKENKLEKQ